jgi:hypothetical protein
VTLGKCSALGRPLGINEKTKLSRLWPEIAGGLIASAFEFALETLGAVYASVGVASVGFCRCDFRTF